MTNPVQAWWIFLCAIAVLNCIAWLVSANVLTRHRSTYSATDYRQRRWLLWLSAGYVAGCAFRSFLPRIDLERVCLAQTWLSYMSIGRSVATIAELCFMAQCALLLHMVGTATNNRPTIKISQLLVPAIIIAECASWFAILSTNYVGHVVENSIWTVCAVLLLASFLLLWPHSNRRQRHFLLAMMAFAVAYIAFMTTVDVPMYWVRWQQELAVNKPYLTLLQGFADASRSCVVNFDYAVWRQEIPWMTLYFTVAVWVSIYLPHAPRYAREQRVKIS